jgi:hypothetical protein
MRAEGEVLQRSGHEGHEQDLLGPDFEGNEEHESENSIEDMNTKKDGSRQEGQKE